MKQFKQGFISEIKIILCDSSSFFFFQSTSNYHARKYGVRAAMPGFIAKKLCPNLIIVPPNFDKYRAVSDEVRAPGKIHKHSDIYGPLILHNRWVCMSLLDSWDFCRLWPSLHANEPGWSLSGFHWPPGAETGLAWILPYTSLSDQ